MTQNKLSILKSLKIWIYIFATFSCFALQTNGQDIPVINEYVSGTFSSTQLINTQTTEMYVPKSWGFMIQHRFGAISPDESAYKQFLGLDLPSNIRFAFAVPFSERVYAELGRTKTGKTVDLGVKLNIDKQTKDNLVPVSIAMYLNTAVTTEDFPSIDTNTFFVDSITPFKYVFNHRLAYNYQIIVSRKFGNAFSMQIAPTIIYKNLAEPGKDNYTVAVPISGRIKVGITSSILFEYTPLLNNRSESDHLEPVSIAYEIGTVGHVFQIVISSSNHLLEKENYTNPSFDYLDGDLLLGFNLKRTFWSKKQGL